MRKKDYEYYHDGRTPAEDGMVAAKKENFKVNYFTRIEDKGIKAIKIIWMRGGEVLSISFAKDRKEAEKKITESHNREWTAVRLMFWSQRLGRYVTIPK